MAMLVCWVSEMARFWEGRREMEEGMAKGWGGEKDRKGCEAHVLVPAQRREESGKGNFPPFTYDYSGRWQQPANDDVLIVDGHDSRVWGTYYLVIPFWGAA